MPTTKPVFAGTVNPRHIRALHFLMSRPAPRRELDNRAGCANAPELIAELRRRNLQIPCERVPMIDRDGRKVWVGVYALSPRDRLAVANWLAGRA